MSARTRHVGVKTARASVACQLYRGRLNTRHSHAAAVALYIHNVVAAAERSRHSLNGRHARRRRHRREETEAAASVAAAAGVRSSVRAMRSQSAN